MCLNHLVIGPSATPPTPNGDYGIGLEQLVSITRDHNISALQEYGGVICLWIDFALFIWFTLLIILHQATVTSLSG